ncbi:MAG: hypothetical protein LW834_16420 [Cyanobium sp. 49614_E6]|nr:hypothetical protein [Cyanobium sp. 49614_E6]
MKISHCLPAFALATTCLFTGIAKAQVIVADTIYTGGEIVTINDKQPSAEALAVKGGKIVAVGSRAAVEKAHKGANTLVVDLAGKALLPGFIDAHSHYISPSRSPTRSICTHHRPGLARTPPASSPPS